MSTLYVSPEYGNPAALQTEINNLYALLSNERAERNRIAREFADFRDTAQSEIEDLEADLREADAVIDSWAPVISAARKTFESRGSGRGLVELDAAFYDLIAAERADTSDDIKVGGTDD